jgi:hypothetical protein
MNLGGVTMKARRQRVTWETIDLGKVEIVNETWTQTQEYCVACGRQGTWMGDESRRVCVHCGTVQRLSEQPEPATHIYAVIARQLQLAEAASA